MTKLVSIPKIKKTLYADWALRVKQRDGFKCLLCGATENLTSHHWYICDHHAHAARYSVENGATLCYACHIRGIHTRADYVSITHLLSALVQKGVSSNDFMTIDSMACVEVNTSLLRGLWDAMRSRTVSLNPYQIGVKGTKTSAWVLAPQRAVVGNVVSLNDDPTRYEVCVVKKLEDKNMFRYTLKPVEDAK